MMTFRLQVSSFLKKRRNPFGVSSASVSYVPEHAAASDLDVEKLAGFLGSSGSTLVLTGAGVSTESGIPDYRSEGVGLYATSRTRPILFKEFLASEIARKRYWLRNFVGWRRFSSVHPNFVHFSLKRLQDLEVVGTIVTQNVDNLHTAAGSQDVIELHGSAHRVGCVSCDYVVSRFCFQSTLGNVNPNINTKVSQINPDGDAEVIGGIAENFQVPECPQCGGILKPDIVFFGDSVPKERVDLVKDKVAECESLIVLGTSLTVFSSYRIVLQAYDLKKHLAIINIGPTRGDEICDIKLNVRCGEIMSKYCSLFDKH